MHIQWEIVYSGDSDEKGKIMESKWWRRGLDEVKLGRNRAVTHDVNRVSICGSGFQGHGSGTVSPKYEFL